MNTDRIIAQFKGKVGGFSVDADFEIPLSGVTALFGPSGSGKTTILRCLAGLTKLPGSLSVGNLAWQTPNHFTPPHLRPIGFAFQQAELFPHLSVNKNLDFAEKRSARRQGAGTPIDRSLIVELLGLSHLLRRMPTNLSGGERQRVGIARALLSRPRLLLLDEPLAGLDQLAKEEILPYLDNLTTASNVPIIYVSHDIGEVARLSDLILQISKGRVVGMGPVSEMVERLGLNAGVSLFEESVLLTGHIASHDKGNRMTQIGLASGQLAAPLIDLPLAHKVRIRVRARDVAIALEAPKAISIRNILPATVVNCATDQATGSANVSLDLGGENLRARITLASLNELDLRPGNQVFALIKSVTFDGR